MKVAIKKFDVEMELKNKGVEFEIRSPQDVFLGDIVLTKTQLIWCRGRTTRENGKSISIPDLIAYMENL